jgi:hypothetical protein
MKYPLEHDRIREAYFAMAKAGYRPAAPGDGCGSISLTRKQLADPVRLEREAQAYADNYIKEEDRGQVWMGCADLRLAQAKVYAIEAARLLCGVVVPSSTGRYALKLLKLAQAELMPTLDLPKLNPYERLLSKIDAENSNAAERKP